MREIRDALFAIVTDQDLHDHSFRCTHVIDNDHVSLNIPLNGHGFRTIQLSANQCIEWGKRLERFGHQILAADPARAGDCRI